MSYIYADSPFGQHVSVNFYMFYLFKLFYHPRGRAKLSVINFGLNQPKAYLLIWMDRQLLVSDAKDAKGWTGFQRRSGNCLQTYI